MEEININKKVCKKIKNKFLKFLVLCITILVFSMLFINKVEAKESYGEFYELDGNYITRILPETRLSDFKNNLENEKILVSDENGIYLSDDDYIGSGMTAEINNKKYKLSVIGDVNGDGKITTTDQVKAQLGFLGLKNLEEKYKNAVDTDNNGNFTITDMSQIKLAVVGIKDFIAPESFTPTVMTTSNSITVSGVTTDRNSGVSEYFFKIDNGNWVQATDKSNSTYTFLNVSDEKHTVRMKVKDNAGNQKKTKAIEVNLSEGSIKIIPDKTDWTNEDITVVVEYNCNIVEINKMISIDGGKTFTKYDGPVKVSKNTKIVAKLENKDNEIIEQTSCDIKNIDKLDPKEFEINAETDSTSIKVSVDTQDRDATQEYGKSGIKEYIFKISKGLWNWEITSKDNTFEFTGLKQGQTYNIKVTAIDNAGNETVVETQAFTINPNKGIYAKLYKDGTLGLAVDEDKLVPGKTVNDIAKDYGNIEDYDHEKIYPQYDKDGNIINLEVMYTIEPWKNEKDSIKTLEIVQDIYPIATSYWFYECGNISQVKNIERLHTDLVKDMSAMFYGCANITNLHLRNFKTDKVTNMANMFNGCKKVNNLDVTSFDTSNVENMKGMFLNCGTLKNLDVSGFNTDKVTDMAAMFANCTNLTSIDTSKFNTSKVTSMESMFFGCSNLTTLDLSNFDTSKVTLMRTMFNKCNRLTNLNVSSFDTSKVTSMQGMFSECNNLTTLDLKNFNTQNVVSMDRMFSKCTKLNNLNVRSFKTTNLKDMNSMFEFCTSLTDLDLSSFETKSVINMEGLFDGCTKLANLNINNFNTQNVINMGYMFENCTSLTNLNLRSFNTKNVQTMYAMFYNCAKLSTIQVSSNWVTSNANTEYMLGKCNAKINLL